MGGKRISHDLKTVQIQDKMDLTLGGKPSKTNLECLDMANST